jgi:hypothetical protein
VHDAPLERAAPTDAATLLRLVWPTYACRTSQVVAAPKATVATTNPTTMATMKSYLSQPCPPRCGNGIGQDRASASGNAIVFAGGNRLTASLPLGVPEPGRFATMCAGGFAERARVELRATGERPLHQAFWKLGVESRTQFARHVLESAPRAT